MISRFVYAGAERAPEALAMVCNGRRLTYGELARAIEATIQAFEGQGVGGEPVKDLLPHGVRSD